MFALKIFLKYFKPIELENEYFIPITLQEKYKQIIEKSLFQVKNVLAVTRTKVCGFKHGICMASVKVISKRFLGLTRQQFWVQI